MIRDDESVEEYHERSTKAFSDSKDKFNFGLLGFFMTITCTTKEIGDMTFEDIMNKYK